MHFAQYKNLMANSYVSAPPLLPAGQTAGWDETHHYRNETLMDNWNEERFDKKWVSKPKPLPSGVGYAYTSTYQGSYNGSGVPCKQAANLPIGHVANAFPYHQRELDPDGMKKQVDLFQSENRTEFVDPRLRYLPMSCYKK